MNVTDRPITRAERLRFDLSQIRKELADEIARVTEDHFEWAPASGMKTYRDQLLETGTMERESISLIRTGVVPEWQTLWDALAEHAQSASSLLSAMDQDRAETLRYLDECDAQQLQTQTKIPENWIEYFGSPTLSPEELIAWIMRHEYYHLGQIIIYNWIRGDNPYKR